MSTTRHKSPISGTEETVGLAGCLSRGEIRCPADLRREPSVTKRAGEKSFKNIVSGVVTFVPITRGNWLTCQSVIRGIGHPKTKIPVGHSC